MTPRGVRLLAYGGGFAVFFIFLAWGYGDVLARAEQESYICADPSAMHYVLSQPGGAFYWLSRWGLLLFKWPWLGALCLATVYTLTAWLTDRALRLSFRWTGLGYMLPSAELGWMLWQGTRLYYRSEPSLFVLIAVALLLLATLAAVLSWLVGTRRELSRQQPSSSVRPLGALCALAALIVVAVWGRWGNENVVLTARMQNLEARADWHAMIVTGRQARRPSRAVAAYYAMALTERDCLVEGLFLIPHDYPPVQLGTTDGPGEEYGLFLADACYHAGLLNSARHAATNRLVMEGPRLAVLKRLALCALLQGERSLCHKYLTMIAANPFENAFVERLHTYLAHPDRVTHDETLAHVMHLAPHDSQFEQAYTPPIYIGYNLALTRGNAYGLQTSLAACLYAKRLDDLPQRADVLAANGRPFPDVLQQALVIASQQRPELIQRYPQIGRFVPAELTAFLTDAQPYKDEPATMRRKLRDRWGGTYYYYYFTENTDSTVTAGRSADGGVN